MGRHQQWTPKIILSSKGRNYQNSLINRRMKIQNKSKNFWKLLNKMKKNNKKLIKKKVILTDAKNNC